MEIPKDIKIGFIGQGYIGKHYADDFESRRYNVVRYALEEPYLQNGHEIAKCDIVFIAVPTPTTPQGFDGSILRSVIKKVGKEKIAVIKSTVPPGTTEEIQKENPGIYVIHSPEFLTETTASFDASRPARNIIGIPEKSEIYEKLARLILSILPKAPYNKICSAREAELIKYGGNCWFYFKVIFINMLYDLGQELGVDYGLVKEAMAADPRIGETHLDPIHKSGRGAGGHCFIKDFAAFTEFYKDKVGNEHGLAVLDSLKNKNIHLLIKSKKDLDLLVGVYGDEIVKKIKEIHGEERK